MACPCGDRRCPDLERLEEAEQRVRERERKLDEAYEGRRWARVAWLRHLDELGGRKAA